jgi:peptidoglycan hydrolase-like protein with peptidoglycan-binding domain
MKAAIRTVGSLLQANPSIAVGACTFAVAFSLVAGNALYGQAGKHPGPLWSTRDPLVTRAISAKRETRKAPERMAAVPGEIQAIPVPVLRPNLQSRDGQSRELVRGAQQALAAMGVYGGEVDGLMGPRTRDAIIRFQKSAGLAADGESSVRLLDAIRAAQKSSSAQNRAAADPAVVNSVREMLLAGRESPPLQETESLADATRAAVIARIQIGLSNAGEAGVSVDGQLSEATVAAIRAFQSRYGMKVDGEPGPDILRKLEAIGVLQKI